MKEGIVCLYFSLQASIDAVGIQTNLNHCIAVSRRGMSCDIPIYPSDQSSFYMASSSKLEHELGSDKNIMEKTQLCMVTRYMQSA